MSDRLDAFARRLADDPAFLSSAMQTYAASEGLDGPALAAFLGCAPADLGPLGLCRRPTGDRLQADVETIAARFNLTPDALFEVVRRADVLDALRVGSAAQMLAAARDRPEDEEET